MLQPWQLCARLLGSPPQYIHLVNMIIGGQTYAINQILGIAVVARKPHFA